jgi:hypothetical protein
MTRAVEANPLQARCRVADRRFPFSEPVSEQPIARSPKHASRCSKLTGIGYISRSDGIGPNN